MMMRIDKIVCLSIILLLLAACEEKEWVARDVELVPVYTLSSFDNNTPLKQDVYQTKPVMIEFSTATQLLKFEMSNFNDQSTDSSYHFSYTLTMNNEVDNGIDTIIKTLITRDCVVKAAIDSINDGTLHLIEHFRLDTVSAYSSDSVYATGMVVDTLLVPTSVVVHEDEKYYTVE